MNGPVIVYPNSLDAAPSEPDERRMEDFGSADEGGQVIRWYYTTSRPESDCAYCADGRCEQRVEWVVMGPREIVVHDRPRWVQ